MPDRPLVLLRTVVVVYVVPASLLASIRMVDVVATVISMEMVPDPTVCTAVSSPTIRHSELAIAAAAVVL